MAEESVNLILFLVPPYFYLRCALCVPGPAHPPRADGEAAW